MYKFSDFWSLMYISFFTKLVSKLERKKTTEQYNILLIMFKQCQYESPYASFCLMQRLIFEISTWHYLQDSTPSSDSCFSVHYVYFFSPIEIIEPTSSTLLQG